MSYGQRLNAALTHAGKSRRELADILDCTPQAIGIVITAAEQVDRKLATEAHAEAVKFLKVDGYWLATGKGEMNPEVAKPTVATSNLDSALHTLSAHLAQAAPDADDSKTLQDLLASLVRKPGDARILGSIKLMLESQAFAQSQKKSA